MAIKIPKKICFLLPDTSAGEQNNTPRAILNPIFKSFKKYRLIKTGIIIAIARAVPFKKSKLLINLSNSLNINIFELQIYKVNL